METPVYRQAGEGNGKPHGREIRKGHGREAEVGARDGE